jgi:tRNA(Ile2) C34 agmatinyltransferase TiaS
MYFEMKLRDFVCPDCRQPFKSTSPNAVRCRHCSKKWSSKRNREYQRRRYAATKGVRKVQRPAVPLLGGILRAG